VRSYRWSLTRTAGACVLTAVVLLVVSACGSHSRSMSSSRSVYARYSSLRAAAAVLSHHCLRDVTSADSNGLLWLSDGRRPLVYYASATGDPPNEVLSSRGGVLRPWGVLWPCDPPVVIHYPATHTASRSSTALMTVLAPKPDKRKTLRLGQLRFANPTNRNAQSGYANALAGPDGRIIFFSGTKIRYADGPEFTVRGLPTGWQMGALSVSPRNPFVFLAEAEKGHQGGQPCPAAIYRITRTGSSKLKSFDGCTTGLDPVWSPDGRQIAWFVSPNGDTSRLFVSDAFGRHFRLLASKISGGAVWAPDSRTIAYGSGRNPGRTAVVNLRTRAQHRVGIGWPLAWSPDGTHIALIRQSTVIPQPPGTIVSVPLAGRHSRLLFNLPAAQP
jgi:hypothetical protein